MTIQNLSSSEIIKFHESGFTSSSSEESNLFGEDGFSFGDILDIINPLQHIPVISSIYRKLTGDTIAPAMQVAGDALFGGPLGAAISIVKTTIQSQFSTEQSDQDETKTNPSSIVKNSLQSAPTNISAHDYASASNLKIDPSTQSYQSTSPLISIQSDTSIEPIISLNSVNNKGADKYNDVISASTATPNNIDILIGGRADPG